jgi:hypothetical protein
MRPKTKTLFAEYPITLGKGDKLFTHYFSQYIQESPIQRLTQSTPNPHTIWDTAGHA